MSRILVMVGALLVAATPQDAPPDRKCCDANGPKPRPGYNKGVQWTQPFDAAVKKARESNKLLMVFHLVGDMSKEGC